MSAIPTCQFFRQGTCTRGDECPYRHYPLSQKNPPSSSSPKVCQYFVRGSCQYGAACRNTHTTTSPPRSEVKQCSFYLRNSCTKGSSCPFSHGLAFDGLSAGKESITTDTASPFGPCKFFIQGRCTKGSTCPFLHQTGKPEPRPAEPELGIPFRKTTSGNKLEPVAAAPTASTPAQPGSSNGDKVSTTERHLLGAQVIFGPGASIEQVTTAFESCCVNLSNIPPNLSQPELIILLETFGHLKSVTLHKAASASTAMIEFKAPHQAARSISELNLTNIHSYQLAARLVLRAGESGTAMLRSCKVKLSWYAPSLVAWAHFPTISLAFKVQRRIDGQLCQGRRITSVFQTPGLRQTGSFSVEIKGLPSWVNVKELKKFCDSNSITLGEPTYREEEGIRRLRKALETFGHLDAFDVLPAGKQDGKIKAFAQFSTSEAAENAVGGLHGQPQDYFRRGPLFMEIVHSVKYNVPAQHFEIIRLDLDYLCSRSNECKIRYYHRDNNGSLVDPVCVRIYSTDPKQLGQAKVDLEQLLGGRVLALDGEEVWDDYFNTTEAKSLFQTVSKDCHVYVNCDTRKRRLKLSGRDVHLTLAENKILDKIEEIRSQCRVLSLELPLLRRLMMGGLAELVSNLEGSTISLDVVARTLTVHGEQAAQKVERVIAGLTLSTTNPTFRASATNCPVCFCEADNSTTLACGHSYCTLCLQHLLKSAPDTKSFPIHCVSDHGSQCPANVPLSTIRDVMSPNDEEKILEVAFLSFLNRQPEGYRYCPTPDCQIIYRPGPQGTALRCPSCLVRICPACHVEFHEGLTCKEHQDNNGAGQMAYLEWRAANNVKSCPKCSVDIEKNGGCSHITCVGCKTHICWVCMKTFADDDGSGGVYAHMRNVHGGIV